MKRETKFPWWGWVGILCLLPVLYVLSIFPVIWVLHRFELGEPTWLERFYMPLTWAVSEWEWFGGFFTRVFEWMGIA